jgi:hypothetical protein
MDSTGISMRGIYRDRLKGADGQLLYDSGWVPNTIVERCRILLTGFMKNEPSNGIQYLAVGQGLKDWDITGAPVPDTKTTTDLVNRFKPTVPVANLDLVYLDESANAVIGPTNHLQITAALPPGYPAPIPPLNTYPLREFGLFGRFGGVDYMINSIRHPVIHKDASATLIRVIQLHF